MIGDITDDDAVMIMTVDSMIMKQNE